MSSSSHFTGQVAESHNYLTQAIPHSLQSNNSAQSIRANNRHFQLATSSSSSQSSGGVLLWNIPPTQGAISRGTMYLRCRVSVATTAAPTYADAANSLFFAGPGPLTAGIKSDGTAIATAQIPALSNGYSWMQRLTLYGTGSAVIDQMNYVNDCMNLMLSHNSHPSYLENDGQICLAVCRPSDTTSATSQYWDLCLPLPLSCFNNSQHDFPLYLAKNPLTLQVDLSSFARAISTGATTAGTDYTVSNAYLCYEVLELPHAMIEAERHAVQSGHPFIMPLQSWLNVQVPMSILSSYTIGANCSSVRGVYVLPYNAAAYTSAAAADNYARNTSDAAANWGSGINAQLYCDGNIKNSSIFDNPVMQFTQLKQALHNNIQSSVINPSLSKLSSYLLNYYALAFDCVSFDDESTIFGGTPVTNLNIQLTGYTTQPTYITTIAVLYDTLLSFGADGIMEIKR
jgi:hypothetical protein